MSGIRHKGEYTLARYRKRNLWENIEKDYGLSLENNNYIFNSKTLRSLCRFSKD